MGLEKIEITPLRRNGERDEGKKFKVLFNPNSYSITKSVTWSTPQPSTAAGGNTDRKVNAPTLTFGGGGSRQLTLELFYDVTEPVNGVPVDDVRIETKKMVELTTIQRELNRPPAVEISWGHAPLTGSDFPFRGVISSLVQRFTLFTGEGKPVRATLSVTFTEFLDPEMDQRQTDPEFTTRLVKRGDSLAGIAAEVYHDASLWRIIAQANDLNDPRQLPIGLRLAIPKT